MKRGGMALLCLILFSCLSVKSVYKSADQNTAIVNSQDKIVKNPDESSKKTPDSEPLFDVEPNPDTKREKNSPLLDKDLDDAVVVKNISRDKIKKDTSADNRTGLKTDDIEKQKKNELTDTDKKKSQKNKTFSKNSGNLKTKTILKPVNMDKNDRQTHVKKFKVENDLKPYKIKKIEPNEIRLIKEEIHDKNFDLSKINNITIDENTPKESVVNENDEVIISLANPGWIIKNISSDILKLLGRENLSDSTTFKFGTNAPGESTIVFLRFDPEKNDGVLQTYRIIVKPDNIFGTDKKKQSNANETEDFRKTIADNLYNQEKYADAKARYAELLKDGKDAADIYYKLGMIEKALGNDAAALENFMKNINEKENPFFGEALAEMIKLQKKLGKFQDAINSFYTYGMNESIPKKAQEELYLLLADIYYGMNDYSNAAKEYRRFISLYPLSASSDKALFYLAYSMENYKINPDFKGAYGLYKELLSKFPESKYYSLSKNRMLFLERHHLKVN